jgi:hypothetical protein
MKKWNIHHDLFSTYRMTIEGYSIYRFTVLNIKI